MLVSYKDPKVSVVILVAKVQDLQVAKDPLALKAIPDMLDRLAY
jgi:hypothetical protein